MLLVAWLHIAAHLPFKYCDVILTVVGYVLAETGQNTLVPLLHSTLTSCLATLRLEPSFHAYPTCPECLAVYPDSIAPDVNTRCSGCGHPLFKANSEDVHRRPRRRRGAKHPKAYLRTPAKSLTEQLGELLMRPGMEDALESWRKRVRSPGWLTDFFDGAISHELLGPDNKPFFRRDLMEDPDGELRIGVALGVDWFSYLRSQIAPSYSSCLVSFNIVNLPPFLRYRASNLLLSMIIPGPKESDPDQTQGFMVIVVNELIRLWRDGAVLPTYRCPQGRRIRVILVGVFCDKPAAHKLGGFGPHQHTFFCTRDWISQGLISALLGIGFWPRTNEQHRWLMDEYRQAPGKSAREEHATSYATRWSELARLPYFDLCRMIVVDPMHNLFLGKATSTP
ncbi:hypothetical protein BV20DRAFT_955703 [Pilatotrama ljubarskyi]|nr:hypothetical protein BV20DRAFT_955703 [Pilatotrama ljubarskyi]